MKLKNEVLYNQYFNAALNKIASIDMEIKSLIKLNKMIDTLKSEHSSIDKIKTDILKKFAKLKDDGEIETNNNQVVFKDTESQTKAFEKLNELMNTDFDVDFDKIKIKSDVKLTYAEYKAIEDLIEVVD